jgi:hypothetical protein
MRVLGGIGLGLGMGWAGVSFAETLPPEVLGDTFTEGSDIDLIADETTVGAGTSVEFFGGADGTSSLGTDSSGPPWTETDPAVTPGVKLYRIRVDGGAYSQGTQLTVTAQAATILEPDPIEQILVGTTFELQATTFDDSVTTGVSFRITGPSSYDQTFAGSLSGGVWSYNWDTTSLPAGSYSVTATRTGAWGSITSGAVSCSLQASPGFVAFATATNDSSANRTCDLSGAGLASGDIILVHVSSRVTGTLTFTPPAGEGWTKITETERIVSGALDVCYWKRWGAGGGQTDDSTPTFTLSAAGALWNVTATVWRGCKSSGNPYTVTPVKAELAAPSGPPYVLTSGVLASAPGASSTTVWAFHANDDNTLNSLSRGTLITSYNISNGASMGLAYEAAVDSSVQTASFTQSTRSRCPLDP